VKPPTAHGAPERALTLVELVVALVLLAIVVGFAGAPLINGLRGSDDVQSRTQASQRASDATEHVRNDLAAALAPDRDARHVRGVEKLTRALLEPGYRTLSDDPSYGARQLDVRDVVRATPTELHFRADVLAADRNAPVECVRWRAAAPTSPQYWLERTVYGNERLATGTSCAGTALVTDMELPPTDRVAGRAPAATFSYEVLGSNCTVTLASTVSGSDLNRIVAVRVDLVGVGSRRASVAVDNATSVAVLTSRESTTYRRALGCG